ncbi:MAG TPA: hypothetical protein VF862_08950 [Gemmatimonadales bacterium]
MTRGLRIALGLTVVLWGLPATLAGQASQFGVRSLGLPLLPVSAATQGTGGGFALFDPESAINPASLSGMGRAVASFGLRQYWRTSENPYGSEGGNDTAFPLILVGGPIGNRFGFGVSASGLTDRTFSVGLADTVIVRDAELILSDTLISKGGVSDIRFGGSFDVSSRLSVGLGLHVMTGTNRIEYRRSFSDSTYFPVQLRNELSFAGPGVSVGLLAEPLSGLRVSAMYRWDGDLKLNKDSTRIAEIPMPRTIAAGLQWNQRRLTLGGHVLARNWSVQDDYITERDGTGASNTLEVAAGGQLVSSLRQPAKFPLRFGARWASLPYPLTAGGDQGSEFSVSAGSGLLFGGGRGIIDFALERSWRSGASGYTEKSFALALGVAIRP